MALSRPVSTAISPLGRQNQAPLAAYGLNRCREQRNQLTLTNLPLVKQLARRESQRTPVPMEDLEQTGCLGLIKALEAFDPDRSAALSSLPCLTSAAPSASTCAIAASPCAPAAGCASSRPGASGSTKTACTRVCRGWAKRK
jgi:hypothetical protein